MAKANSVMMQTCGTLMVAAGLVLGGVGFLAGVDVEGSLGEKSIVAGSALLVIAGLITSIVGRARNGGSV